jgi:hypothetical protein
MAFSIVVTDTAISDNGKKAQPNGARQTKRDQQTRTCFRFRRQQLQLVQLLLCVSDDGNLVAHRQLFVLLGTWTNTHARQHSLFPVRVPLFATSTHRFSPRTQAPSHPGQW